MRLRRPRPAAIRPFLWLLEDAGRAAGELGHQRVGTEHLLLALLEDDGRAGEALRETGVDAEAVLAELDNPARPLLDADALLSIGIDLDAVRVAVEETFGAGALERGGCRPLSPRLKRVLDAAQQLAVAREDDPDSGHVLRALLDAKGSSALLALDRLGLSGQLRALYP